MNRAVPRQLRSLPQAAALALAGLLLAGCQGAPALSDGPAALAATNTPAPADPAGRGPSLSDPAGLSRAAEDHARHLQAAMARTANLVEPPSRADDPGREVVWLDTRAGSDPAGTAALEKGPARTATSSTGALIRIESPGTGHVTATAAGSTAKPVDAAARRQALAEDLRQAIRAAKDPALARALAAAAVAAADPKGKLEPADLAGLDAGQRQTVEGYHRLLRSLAARIAAGELRGSPEDLVKAPTLDGNPQAGPPPLKVRAVELCRRVRGYGVIEPFETGTFLAGRPQKIIVYVELDHFKSAPGPGGLQQVKLTQEISLYNDKDGLKVWGLQPVESLDESRNVRRDFFVGQIIELPATLTVGKYQLKVRVTDVFGDSADEVSVPLQIVADQKLVSSAPVK